MNEQYFIEVNKPRIQTVEEWIKILRNERNYKGFCFVEKILVPIYHKPKKYVFMKAFEEETGIRGMNLRVGEFGKRIMKMDGIKIQDQLRFYGGSRYWNIPFYSEETLNDESHFSWCLREELIEAMEIVMPELLQL